MKSFNHFFARCFCVLPILAASAACSNLDTESSVPEEPAAQTEITPEAIAKMLSSIPIGQSQANEVWNAVNSSISNGYDEEYPFWKIINEPGSGVGDSDSVMDSRSSMEGSVQLRSLINEYASGLLQTRSDDFMTRLAGSGLQIYWPYSEDWDGNSIPVITFDPENGSESNEAYVRVQKADGIYSIRKIKVDEAYAAKHPVWVVNRNDDAEFITPQMLERLSIRPASVPARTEGFKTLVLKEFNAHRQYDSWFSGGSEFFVKCGSLKAFKARTEEEMDDYDPQITDFMIKVRRKQAGKTLRFNSVLVSEWSDQLCEAAFMVVEDDGGKMTKWSALGTVKIKSRSYGFEVEFPYHRSDDIVWRGKLSGNYLEKYNCKPARFGDVSITFSFI